MAASAMPRDPRLRPRRSTGWRKGPAVGGRMPATRAGHDGLAHAGVRRRHRRVRDRRSWCRVLGRGGRRGRLCVDLELVDVPRRLVALDSAPPAGVPPRARAARRPAGGTPARSRRDHLLGERDERRLLEDAWKDLDPGLRAKPLEPVRAHERHLTVGRHVAGWTREHLPQLVLGAEGSCTPANHHSSRIRARRRAHRRHQDDVRRGRLRVDHRYRGQAGTDSALFSPSGGSATSSGRSFSRRSSWALAATMMVEALMRMAPTAMGMTKPQGARTPAASGMATTL